MSYLLAWFAIVVVFLVIDAIWLTRVMKPIFLRYVGELMRESPKLGVAGAFYAVYCAGILYFAAIPAAEAGDPLIALRDGAILGLMAYGTYEATNMATLRGWSWPMVAIDTAWGTALTAVSALAGYAALAL
ncbi:MAG: DUF2177 family protein [Paracoccaceae bacterium]